MQIVTGVRRVLSNPLIYSTFQSLMGGRQGWAWFSRDYLKVGPSDALLDIGCGPADILDFVTCGVYYGYDISPEYISSAKSKYGHRGRFECKEFEETDLAHLPDFDVVLLSGILHHLEDSEAQLLIRLAFGALKPRGRLVTIDPCLVQRQHPIARLLIRADRGQNVREKNAYEELVGTVFSSTHVEVRHQTWIPYTHCIMQCHR